MSWLCKNSDIQRWTLENFKKMEIFSKIESFGRLPEGWDFGKGIPAPKEVIDAAKRIHIVIFAARWVFDRRNRVSATPCTDGGIILCYSRDGGDDFIVLRINPNLEIDLDHEKGIGSEYDLLFEQSNVGIEVILSKLTEIGVLGNK